MIKRIVVLEKLGANPGTERQTTALLELFMNSKVPWVMDFSGVESLTLEFMEGFFGKAYDLLGRDMFQRRLSWVKLESKSQRTLHAFLQERLKISSN
jgi:hypothetical protein